MPGPFNATDFGFNVPGILGASATGTTLNTATVLVTQGTVFTTVAVGGIALLPSATASNVMLSVFNQGTNTLSVAAQSGGFINFSSTPALILPGGVSFFFCFDPPLGSGLNWFAFDGGNGGGGGGGSTFTQQVSQAVSAAAYGTGQAVGGLMTFNASARSPLYSGNVTGMTFNLPDTQTPTLDVLLFNASPTTSTITNRATVVISLADQAKQIGVVHVSDCTGTQTVCQSQQNPIGYQLPGVSTTLYAAIVARNSFTPSNLPVGAPAWLVSLVTQQN